MGLGFRIHAIGHADCHVRGREASSAPNELRSNSPHPASHIGFTPAGERSMNRSWFNLSCSIGSSAFGAQPNTKSLGASLALLFCLWFNSNFVTVSLVVALVETVGRGRSLSGSRGGSCRPFSHTKWGSQEEGHQLRGRAWWPGCVRRVQRGRPKRSARSGRKLETCTDGWDGTLRCWAEAGSPTVWQTTSRRRGRAEFHFNPQSPAGLHVPLARVLFLSKGGNQQKPKSLSPKC